MRCCHSHEYAELFSEREARRTARRFARKGLRGSARDIAEAVTAAGVEGATVLEVGGGVGDLHAQLLLAGAASATNVELSPNWEAPAGQLLADHGLAGRVERRLGDVLDLADALAQADVVVMHRVLCCYPDWRAMLETAVAKAGRLVAFTVPVDRWWTRAAVRAGNAFLSVRGRSFRAFVHSPSRMIAMVEDAGLGVREDRRRLVWRTVVAEHPAGDRRNGP